MLNMVRRETFEIDVSFDGDPGDLTGLGIIFSQDGHTVLTKELEEIFTDGTEYAAVCTLSGTETARFRAGRPAYAQVEGILEDGEALHSDVAEISVSDVLGCRSAAWRRETWK